MKETDQVMSNTVQMTLPLLWIMAPIDTFQGACYPWLIWYAYLRTNRKERKCWNTRALSFIVDTLD